MSNSPISWRMLKCIISFVVVLIASLNLYAGSKGVYALGQSRSFPEGLLEESSSGSGSQQSGANSVEGTVENEIEKIHSLAQKVKDEGRLLDRIGDLAQIEYPVGITGGQSDLNYAIILESDYVNTEGAFLTAYMSFEVPSNGRKLAFRAKDIPLSAEGGINGDVNLALVNDQPIDLGENVEIIIQGNEKSFVTFNCDGFKSLTIDALIKFNSNFFSLEDPATGNTQAGEMITNFITTVYSWNELLVEVNLPAFQIKPLKGFGFEVKTAVFDFSDFTNHPNVQFPEGYQCSYFDAGLDNLWQGFYIKEATIRTPANLNNGIRKAFKANNLIIDYTGFSGIFSATGLIPLNEGDLDGWAFSLDEVKVEFMQGNLISGGLSGQIILPISDEASAVNYSAYIDQKGDLFFNASMPKQLDVNVWKAQVIIDPSSVVSFAKINDQYSASVELNGHININSPIGKDNEGSTEPKKGFRVSGLRFQGMVIATRNPNFRIGVWSMDEMGVGNDKLSKFSLTIKDVHAHELSPTENAIKFTVRVSLMKGKYAAEAKLSVIGKMAYEAGDGEIVRQKWKYSNTEVHSIYMKVESAISIEGYFEIYKSDPVFGDGVAGSVSVKFPAIKIGISATAQFGEVDGFKYWYVDAFVDLTRTPITISGLAIYGLGGGAYHHMKQKMFDDVVVSASAETKEPEVGSSSSGIGYIPDKSTFIGLKAMVVIGTAGSPAPFNADVTFEVTFNDRMGIKTLALYGNGYIMSPLKLGGGEREASVKCSVFIGMDFENKVMHGNFKVYINVAGGIIKGINAGGLAGEMVIHYDPHDWYIHIGRPATPVGVAIDLGFMKIEAGNYFMIGTIVDPMPPPPQKVLDLLDMEYVPNRDLDAMFTGKGFSFGSFFRISTGQLNVLMFYASFDMGMGFDVMLGNYGNATCVETGKKIGINGWYAQGQAYAYIEGEIGIRIKVFTLKVDAEILKIGAAALLETKLPNPFWLRGTVGGYYSILGGKVKGSCKFQFEVGKLCTIKKDQQESSIVETLAVIGDISPTSGAQDIDVFNAPQVAFNYEINEPFSIKGNEGKMQTFKVVYDYVRLKDNDGNIVKGTLEWNGTNDVVAFNSHDILPGQADMSLEVKIHFEEKVGSIWKKVIIEGQEVSEAKSIKFVTGEAPKYIPQHNVLYSYPLPDQVNFYKGEYNKGYIQLERGQEYLFNPGSDWVQKGRYKPVSGGPALEFNFSYNEEEKTIVYTHPSNMANNVVYRFEIVNKPTNAAGAVDQNITTETQSTGSGDGNTIEMESKRATGTLSILQEKTLYTCDFRTSSYNTLSSKINSFNDWRNFTYNIFAGADKIGKNFYSNELFDYYETQSNEYCDPLIRVKALDNAWLDERVKPLVYANYPIENVANIAWRNTDELGLIPYLALSTAQYEVGMKLTAGEKESGFVSMRNGRGVFIYDLSYYIYYDYYEIQNKVANSGKTSSRISQILSNTCPTIRINTSYPIEVKYVLPGINTVTSTKVINIEL